MINCLKLKNSEGEKAVSLNVFFVKKIGENGAIDHVPDLGREDLPFCVACCRSKSSIRPFKRNSETYGNSICGSMGFNDAISEWGNIICNVISIVAMDEFTNKHGGIFFN